MKPETASDSIVEEVTIHAPAGRVFEALTDPDQIVRWWNVEGRFEAEQVEAELRPSGRWLMRGVGMNGRPFTIRGQYRIVDRPHTLVFTWLPDWQDGLPETVVRIELTEQRGFTTVRLTHSGLVTEDARAAHQGWPRLLDRLRHFAELELEGRV